MKHGFTIYDASNAPAESRDLLNAVQEQFGMIPNALGAMAESPQALGGYLALGELAAKTSLSPEEQHLVMLTVARENECPYCIPAVSALAKSQGVGSRHLERIKRDETLDDTRYQALRAFTQKLVIQRGWIDDEEIAAMRAHGYDRRQILDVILLTMMKSMAIYANHIMGTDLDEAFEPERWERVA